MSEQKPEVGFHNKKIMIPCLVSDLHLFSDTVLRICQPNKNSGTNGSVQRPSHPSPEASSHLRRPSDTGKGEMPILRMIWHKCQCNYVLRLSKELLYPPLLGKGCVEVGIIEVLAQYHVTVGLIIPRSGPWE